MSCWEVSGSHMRGFERLGLEGLWIQMRLRYACRGRGIQRTDAGACVIYGRPGGRSGEGLKGECARKDPGYLNLAQDGGFTPSQCRNYDEDFECAVSYASAQWNGDEIPAKCGNESEGSNVLY